MDIAFGYGSLLGMPLGRGQVLITSHAHRAKSRGMGGRLWSSAAVAGVLPGVGLLSGHLPKWH